MYTLSLVKTLAVIFNITTKYVFENDQNDQKRQSNVEIHSVFFMFMFYSYVQDVELKKNANDWFIFLSFPYLELHEALN